jgi:hypothetical protein
LLDDGRHADEQAGDGIFSLAFEDAASEPGMGELVVKAEGHTFVREKRMTYEVLPPVNLQIEPAETHGKLAVRLAPDSRLVESSSVEVEAWLEDPVGNRLPLSLSSNADGERLGEIDLQAFSGVRKVFVQAEGETLQAEPFSYLANSMEVEGILPMERPEPPRPTPSPVEAPVSEPESVDAPPPISESPAASEEPKPEEPTAPEEDDGDMTDYIWLVSMNLLLLLTAGGGFWWMRKRGQKQMVNLVEETPPPASAQTEEKAA